MRGGSGPERRATAAAAALVPARFRVRPHRFAVDAELLDGRVVSAHLGDPGRLEALLRPGAELRLRPAPASTARRTRYSAVLVRCASTPPAWVSLEPLRANRLAAGLLERGAIRGAGGAGPVRGEVGRGRSRFDFRVERRGREPLWVEVKSVTLVEGGVARFPDAPTERGRRHVTELERLAVAGERAMVLFVVQRAGARIVRPHRAIDPEFAAALAAARGAGVMVRAARFDLSAAGAATYRGPLPVRV